VPAVLFSNELTGIFDHIVKESKSAEEWAEIEADDWFQTKNISGGFDATENAFTFSIFHNDTEYWLQITLDKITEYYAGKVITLDLQPS